jgi:hypothetical protein
MKIWITARYDPNGIEEAEVIDDSTDALMTFVVPYGGKWSRYWYFEGSTWHRTREAAVEAARTHRANWIKERADEAARVAALPAIR